MTTINMMRECSKVSLTTPMFLNTKSYLRICSDKSLMKTQMFPSKALLDLKEQKHLLWKLSLSHSNILNFLLASPQLGEEFFSMDHQEQARPCWPKLLLHNAKPLSSTFQPPRWSQSGEDRVKS